jgi:hypothetical protein
MWTLFEVVWLCCSCGGSEGAQPWSVLTLARGSLGIFGGNNIGEAGARELLTALQFNTALKMLR